MEDFEKNRIEYVQLLEAQIKQLQRDIAIYRPNAEKWVPKFESQINSNGEIALKINDKVQIQTISFVTLSSSDEHGLVSYIADNFARDIFAAQIKPLIEPHISKLKKAAETINNTNNW